MGRGWVDKQLEQRATGQPQGQPLHPGQAAVGGGARIELKLTAQRLEKLHHCAKYIRKQIRRQRKRAKIPIQQSIKEKKKKSNGWNHSQCGISQRKSSSAHGQSALISEGASAGGPVTAARLLAEAQSCPAQPASQPCEQSTTRGVRC